MLVRLMESETQRVRSIARAYGVYRDGLSMRELSDAIVKACRRELEAEERRAMHERAIRRLRDSAA